MKTVVVVGALIGLALYSIVGTSGNVDEIKKLAPAEMVERNWNILRYEGYQFGSFNKHGGKVWYHVANKDNANIQYRVHVTMWDGELQYYYSEPEELNRININYK